MLRDGYNLYDFIFRFEVYLADEGSCNTLSSTLIYFLKNSLKGANLK
jgi:hypothetical protein